MPEYEHSHLCTTVWGQATLGIWFCFIKTKGCNELRNCVLQPVSSYLENCLGWWLGFDIESNSTRKAALRVYVSLFLEKQSIKLWIGLDTAYTLINRFNQHQTKSHKVWNTICIFNMVSNNFSNPKMFSCQKCDIYCRLCRPICGFRKCPVVETCGGFSYLLEWIH